jgi:hypothetical protein
VLYGNHHAFYDAQILGYLTERVLGRRTIVWMDELERFPFLAALGALPFPSDDAPRRIRTIRATRRLMTRYSETALIYFPEAHLHRVEEGILPFPDDRVRRLADVLPSAHFWPVALRVTDWHQATPSAVLAGSPWRVGSAGGERGALADLVQRLGRNDGLDERLLLDGHPGPNERWDFTPIGRALFR